MGNNQTAILDIDDDDGGDDMAAAELTTHFDADGDLTLVVSPDGEH